MKEKNELLVEDSFPTSHELFLLFESQFLSQV
jgi:hypothetical protein